MTADILSSKRRIEAGLPTALTAAVSLFLVIIRIAIGFQPHSGQDNYHGNDTAYGGDFEAQRHWMELTLHLPIGDWYWYDLEYWGLDYPPLTAYVSYICGLLSSFLVGPESVALYESRGMEEPIHKAYMRGTVLVLDVLVYCSAVWIVARPRATSRHNDQSMWVVVMALSQPALLLMDHGHFQYNSVSLGCALWSFHYMTRGTAMNGGGDNFSDCVLGAIWFCLALNFKQMTLYYAPAVFAYLLGRCLAGVSARKFAKRFLSLGMTVISVFALHWLPFVWYPPTEIVTTPSQRLIHVLHRIFPFQRGLFEGKVSNLWCALSTKPISIRKRVPAELQPVLALALTLLLILPACYKLFQAGQSQDRRLSEQSNKKGRHAVSDQDWRLLLWGTTSTSLAFFLASFQVHEKSILMALAPASLLLVENFAFVKWFSIVCAWTLWPLICVDRLEVAYICAMVIFIMLCWLYDGTATEVKKQDYLLGSQSSSILAKWLFPLSFIVMMVLHVLEVCFEAPSNLPDLFPVLWSISGCGMFCLSWLITCWSLFFAEKRPNHTPSLHHKKE